MGTNPTRRTLIWRAATMRTEAEVDAVRREVNQLHGTALLAVDLAAQLITIEYDPDSITPAEIAGFLATAGFPVGLP